MTSGGVNLDNNNGPLVNIAGWFSLVAAILATAGKLYTKWRMLKHLDLNDAVIVSAVVCCCTEISQEVLDHCATKR